MLFLSPPPAFLPQITSDKLATVTGISYGIMDLMFPLSWPHVTIPIMSKSLLDYACCPAPFIMGVHNSLIPILKSMPIEEHVFVYGTFRLNFHRFDRFELDLRGHAQP